MRRTSVCMKCRSICARLLATHNPIHAMRMCAPRSNVPHPSAESNPLGSRRQLVAAGGRDGCLRVHNFPCVVEHAPARYVSALHTRAERASGVFRACEVANAVHMPKPLCYSNICLMASTPPLHQGVCHPHLPAGGGALLAQQCLAGVRWRRRPHPAAGDLGVLAAP